MFSSAVTHTHIASDSPSAKYRICHILHSNFLATQTTFVWHEIRAQHTHTDNRTRVAIHSQNSFTHFKYTQKPFIDIIQHTYRILSFVSVILYTDSQPLERDESKANRIDTELLLRTEYHRHCRHLVEIS